MARLPDKSSRFVLIATFIICSSFLFIDFRFGAFKPVQNFYNSSSIFIRVLSTEYVARPLYRSLSSIWDTRRAMEENQSLKEELNKQLIENFIISNKEILENLLNKCEIDSVSFFKGIKEQKIKDELKDLALKAFKLNVFGDPTFLVNNKLFWGQDRLEYAMDECNIK